ncbi:hypothetical protein L596_020430 [Steinernema carpocapsae]|uniref:RRM domain-containing protein n=1 Tax=Steinernema carpocapsae TaxID=34508 RepID=A0A4U5MTH8_STECR|nr:hypothetical protein L596_020430 [Steinernema carpocapsae]
MLCIKSCLVHLKHYFAFFGNIEKVTIARYPNGATRAFGFIVFQSLSALQHIEDFDGPPMELNGSMVSLKLFNTYHISYLFSLDVRKYCERLGYTNRNKDRYGQWQQRPNGQSTSRRTSDRHESSSRQESRITWNESSFDQLENYQPWSDPDAPRQQPLSSFLSSRNNDIRSYPMSSRFRNYSIEQKKAYFEAAKTMKVQPQPTRVECQYRDQGRIDRNMAYFEASLNQLQQDQPSTSGIGNNPFQAKPERSGTYRNGWVQPPPAKVYGLRNSQRYNESRLASNKASSSSQSSEEHAEAHEYDDQDTHKMAQEDGHPENEQSTSRPRPRYNSKEEFSGTFKNGRYQPPPVLKLCDDQPKLQNGQRHEEPRLKTFNSSNGASSSSQSDEVFDNVEDVQENDHYTEDFEAEPEEEEQEEPRVGIIVDFSEPSDEFRTAPSSPVFTIKSLNDLEGLKLEFDRNTPFDPFL